MNSDLFFTILGSDAAVVVLVYAFLRNLKSDMNSNFGNMGKEKDSRFDKIEKEMNFRFEKVDQRFDKLDEKITDMDRRLCRLEGAFSSKDCCMIKEDRHQKKAE